MNKKYGCQQNENIKLKVLWPSRNSTTASRNNTLRNTENDNDNIVVENKGENIMPTLSRHAKHKNHQ